MVFISLLCLSGCITQGGAFSSTPTTLAAEENLPTSQVEITATPPSLSPSPTIEGNDSESVVEEVIVETLPLANETGEEASQPPTATVTATLDTRPLPDDWQNWDYLPTVSSRAVEIYQKGIASGTDPTHFSVVGDCQAISYVFLGKFDRKEYTLPTGQGALQETIDYFAGSFNRDGMAVRGGFTAASILSPLQSDPDHCQPGETPLDCEFRLNNPSILIVSLETWSKPATIDRYETYLRQIVDTAIEHGVLPILANKADVAEVGGGKHVINPAIARVAYDYDLPMFNFWRSAQFLPNFGIDPERDGFHLSQEGYDLKNLMALQTLDIVRRAVQGETLPTATATLAPIVTIQLTPTMSPSPTVTPSPTALSICQGGEASCLVFGYAASENSQLSQRGVFLFDLNQSEIAQVAPQGVDLQDLSPDRQKLLLNNGSELSVATYSGAILSKISDQFYNLSSRGAYWANDSSVAWISQADGQTAINLYNMRSTESKTLTGNGDQPAELYPYSSDERVFWGKGTCSGYDFCEVSEVYETSIDGSSSLMHDYYNNPVFSPDGVHVAMPDPTFTSQLGYLYNDRLIIEEVENPITSRRLIFFPGARGFMVSDRLIGCSWSADGSKVFVMLDDYSDYFEKSLVLRGYVFDLKTGWLLDYVKIYGAYGSLKPQAIWSPDGTQVALALTDRLSSGEYQVKLFMLDIASKELTDLSSSLNLINPDYAYLTRVFWIGSE